MSMYIGNGKGLPDTHRKIRPAIEILTTIAIVLARLQPKKSNLEKQIFAFAAYVHPILPFRFRKAPCLEYVDVYV